MHQEPDVGFDPRSPGSRPGPKAGAKPLRHPGIPVSSIFNFFLKNFFYECHRERGRDTGRGRSRLHAPGARCGIRSQVSRIVPWAKDRHQTTSPPRDPLFLTYRGPSTLFSTVTTSVRMPTRSVRGLPFLQSLTNTCFLCC